MITTLRQSSPTRPQEPCLARSCVWRLALWLLPALCWTATALAVDLPVPEKLERQYAVRPQVVEVLEPHDSAPERPHRVRYRGLPAQDLLTRWFADSWQDPDAEILLFARDGYRSAVAAQRFLQYRGYLAFGRDDGAAFAVDNVQQRESGIPLGPYYLIWDNLGSAELQRQGSYGWPYQVTRIELQRTSEERRLLPAGASPQVERGFESAREYCLTCHRIRGIGGTKYPVDLLQLACRWKADDLKAWMADPGRIRPGTAMPPLNRWLPEAERARAIDDVVAFLAALEPTGPSGCQVRR